MIIKRNTDFFNFKCWHLWAAIVLLYVSGSLLSNIYIFTDPYYYNTLSGKLTIERIAEIIAFQRKFQAFSYLFIPFMIFIKVSIVAGVIFTGIFLFNRKASYNDCLKITLLAELVSVVSMLIRIGWLMIDRPDTTEAIRSFSPISITQLIDIRKVPQYLIYPLQLINVFEIGYWIVLAYGIMTFTNVKFGKSLKVVASSYGVALLIWVVFIVFLQIQFT